MSEFNPKLLNITGVYSMDSNSFDIKEIKQILEIPLDKKNVLYSEFGSNQILAIPEKNLEIINSNDKLIVNHTKQNNEDPSQVTKTFTDLQKLIHADLKAYGFNLDLEVLLDNDHDFKNWFNNNFINKISNKDIYKANLSFVFKEDKYDLMLEFITKTSKDIVIHFNQHFDSNNLPNQPALNENFKAFVSKSKEILDSIFIRNE